MEARRFVLDLLMSNHREHCFSCPQNGSCKLQDYCMEYGVEYTSYDSGKRVNAPRIRPIHSLNTIRSSASCAGAAYGYAKSCSAET